MIFSVLRRQRSRQRALTLFFDWFTQNLLVDLLGYALVGFCCLFVGMLAHAFEVVLGVGGIEWLSFDVLKVALGWCVPFARDNWGGLAELALFLLAYLCSMKYTLDRSAGRGHPLRDLFGLRSGRPPSLRALCVLSLVVLVAFVLDQRKGFVCVDKSGVPFASASVVTSLAYAIVGFVSVVVYVRARLRGSEVSDGSVGEDATSSLAHWEALVRYRLIWPSIYVSSLCLFHGFEWATLSTPSSGYSQDFLKIGGGGMYPAFIYALSAGYLLLYHKIAYNELSNPRISRVHIVAAALLVFLSALFGRPSAVVALLIGIVLCSYEAWAITGELWEGQVRVQTKDDAELWRGYVRATNLAYCALLIAIPTVLPLIMGRSWLSSGESLWRGYVVTVAVVAYSEVFLSGWYINADGFRRLDAYEKANKVQMERSAMRQLFWVSKVVASLVLASVIVGCLLFPFAVQGLGSRFADVARPFCEFFKNNQVITVAAGTVLPVVQVLSKHGDYAGGTSREGAANGERKEDDMNAGQGLVAGAQTPEPKSGVSTAIKAFLTVEEWIGGYAQTNRYDLSMMPDTLIVVGLLGALLAFVLGVIAGRSMWIGMSFVGLAWCMTARFSEVLRSAFEGQSPEVADEDQEVSAQ